MTLFKHTEPPKESGVYNTNIGILYYFSDEKLWNSKITPLYPEYWLSEHPPKEIEKLLNQLNYVYERGRQNEGHILSRNDIAILLKLRAE